MNSLIFYEFLKKPIIYNISLVKIFIFLVVVVAVLGAPLFSIIAIIAILNFFNSGSSIIVVAQEFSGIANMPLIYSIPLFTFAGYILAASNASRRLVKLTKAALGWMPGGLAIVTLLTCALFTAFTGASGVTIVALGGFLLPALLSEKYEEKFSLGLVTASGSLGLLFPPSLPIIIFGVVAEVVIDDLFIAGAIPGIFLLLVLSAFAAFRSRKFPIERTKFSLKEVKSALWEAKFEILLPIFLFSGIYSGKLAISDAASFTVFYIILIEVFIIKDVKIKQLPAIIKESMTLVGAIILILGASLAATNYIIDQQVPQKIFASIQGVITNKWVFLIVLNIFLLIVGCIMDIFSALVVVVPLILPIAQAYNVNLIHLGVIFLANLEIGYLTPPVGMNLFIASIRFNEPIIKLYRASLIFIGLLFASLLVITYVPELSLWFMDKPAIEGQWQYTYPDGNVDKIILKAGGKYIRKQGSLMDIMMDDGVYGTYSLKRNILTLKTADSEESFKYEIFNDGQRLLLKDMDDKKQEVEEVPDFDDEFIFTDTPVDTSRRFYDNNVSPPLNEKAGSMIGKWSDQQIEFEFYFNNKVKWLSLIHI